MFKPRHTRGQARFKAVQRIHLRVGTEGRDENTPSDLSPQGGVRAVVPLVDAGAKLIVTSGHDTAANHLSRDVRYQKRGQKRRGGTVDGQRPKVEKVMSCEPGEGERGAHHDGAVAGGHVALMSLL